MYLYYVKDQQKCPNHANKEREHALNYNKPPPKFIDLKVNSNKAPPIL